MVILQVMEFLKAKLHAIPKHISCGKLVCQQEFIHPDRVIDSYLLLIGIKNTLFIQEDQEKHQLEKNHVLLLTPHKRQCSFKPSYDLSYYWCHFYFDPREDIEILDTQKAVEIYYMMIHDAYAEKENTILIPRNFLLPYPEKVNILFHQLLDYRYGSYYSQKIANYCLSTILVELTQQSMEHFALDYSPKNTYHFSEIVEWIKINFDKPLSVAEISEAFNYNPTYLSNLFKSKTGYSLIKFIHKTKISKSKELLLKTNKSTKEIAYDLGFSDQKYFLKLFKQYMDITPTQYKNAYFNTHLNKL